MWTVKIYTISPWTMHTRPLPTFTHRHVCAWYMCMKYGFVPWLSTLVDTEMVYLARWKCGHKVTGFAFDMVSDFTLKHVRVYLEDPSNPAGCR